MVRDVIGQAYGALQHNRRRTSLTMLGMAWGIATVVLLLAYGDGFARAIETIFANFGTRIMGVFPGRTSQQAGGAKAGVDIKLTLDDIEVLRNAVPAIRRITPNMWHSTSVQHENRTFQLTVSGTYPSIEQIHNLKMDTGRFFNESDLVTRARVVVLASEAKEKLFSGQPAVDDTVRINGITFTVVGVLKPKRQEGDDDINRVLYIPYTAMGDLKDIRYLNGIWFDYEGPDFERVERNVRETLANQHRFRPDDRRAIFVANLQKQVAVFTIISIGLKVLLGFIGLLTLGIGGVGLMNIMLVSVQQRTREIGVEKALGARRRDILLQFLAEALAITFAGGLVGIVLAYVVSFSVGSVPLYSAIAKNAEAADIYLIIDPQTLLVATTILVFVGVASGMIPAIRASRLDPIEALRYE